MSPRKPESGFSLIEVTLALGIISFALVSLLGLLPAGLSSFRDSMRTTVSAQVSQRLIAEMRQAEFAGLSIGVQPERYFSVEGIEVLEAQKADSVTSARVTVLANALLPGSAAASANLKLIRVEIAPNPGGQVANPFSGTDVKSFVAYVAKTQ